ncbi:hypothetical protein [Streptomyces sp. NPDC088141]|uniref:hypothetical protein n=1 Tax=Streptomyces sp. NPDC088141 TaxID=3155179 RepID=UPI00343840F7
MPRKATSKPRRVIGGLPTPRQRWRHADSQARSASNRQSQLPTRPTRRQSRNWLPTERPTPKPISPEDDWLDELKTCPSCVPEPARGLDEYADAVCLHLREEPDDGRSVACTGPRPSRCRLISSPSPGSASLQLRQPKKPRRRDQAPTDCNAADARTLQRVFLGRIPAPISTAWIELHWVRDVDAQTPLAPASFGVGVRIDVSVHKNLSPAVATIHRLACKVADADRTSDSSSASVRHCRPYCG